MKYAVITGASQGLGRAFAVELSRLKINTILVGLPDEGLPSLSHYLSHTFETSSLYFETDLTRKDHVIDLARKINAYNIYVLINNAGCGGTMAFTEAKVDYIDRIIQLNVMATSLLTHQLLHNLLNQEQSYILNVSSMAAFSPMAYKTVYPASKTFVHSFTRGLSEELKNTNVFVSVVNPGPMKTNSDVTNRINRHGVLGSIGLLSPEKVARISVRQLFRRDTLIMLNFANGVNWLLMTLLPVWVRLPLLSRAIKKELNYTL